MIDSAAAEKIKKLRIFHTNIFSLHFLVSNQHAPHHFQLIFPQYDTAFPELQTFGINDEIVQL